MLDLRYISIFRSITVISLCNKMISVGESSRTIMKNKFTMKTPKEKMSKKEVGKINVERKKFERKCRSYNMSKLLRYRS